MPENTTNRERHIEAMARSWCTITKEDAVDVVDLHDAELAYDALLQSLPAPVRAILEGDERYVVVEVGTVPQPPGEIVVGSMCHCDNPDECGDHWELYMDPKGFDDETGELYAATVMTEKHLRAVVDVLNFARRLIPKQENTTSQHLTNIVRISEEADLYNKTSGENTDG